MESVKGVLGSRRGPRKAETGEEEEEEGLAKWWEVGAIRSQKGLLGL